MLILWIKAFHIIALVTWFSGLFYLPRLFVYHSMSEDEISIERFKIMERKLYYGITTPGMVFTVLLGFWLLGLEPFYASMLWLKIKLILVASLLIFHFYCGHLVKIFKQNRNRKSHVFYRWINEYPTIILIAVVLLAIIKPN